MTTNKTSHPLNTFAFVSEEMERTLRLRAWKDEIFRESLIVDPKGVIQRLFPQCFPDGKLAEQLTIKVIEEDLDTCHLVVPFLPEDFPNLEIPEEEHLELLAHMGADRTRASRDSSEKRQSQPSEKPTFDYTRNMAKQETTNEPLTREKLQNDIASLANKDDDFRKKLSEASKETDPDKNQKMLRNILQEYFPHYLKGSKVSEKQTFKVTQDTADTRHLVFPKLPDASYNPEVPKDKQRQLGLADLRSNNNCTIPYLNC